MKVFSFVLLILTLAPLSLHARVFSYKDTNLATYLRATGGLSSLGQSAFKESSGSQTDSIDGSSKFSYSGEIGFMFGAGNFNVRIGAELLQHRPISDGKGTNASGDELFQLNSSASAFVPNVTAEYTFETKNNTRVYALFGVGYADVTVENRYRMSTAGTAAYSVGNFDELMSATSTSYHAGVGVETLFTDNVTIALDLGYRHLQVGSLKYKTDVTGIGGSASKGEAVVNSDGSKRTLNLGGLNVGVNFRFYLNFL
ncbi:MAG: outer membrane beta-barrel protein [Bdellovibrionales bacterium]|nr:outer membrane beta-barrel protein [Bdellovibrionales bacterium]